MARQNHNPLLKFALTKHHTMTCMEILLLPGDINFVSSSVFDSCCFGLAIVRIYSPRQQPAEFIDLSLMNTERILHDAPMDELSAWRDDLSTLVSEVVLRSDFQHPFIRPVFDIFIVDLMLFIRQSSMPLISLLKLAVDTIKVLKLVFTLIRSQIIIRELEDTSFRVGNSGSVFCDVGKSCVDFLLVGIHNLIISNAGFWCGVTIN
mmetsp:Transcript_24706/g.51380  ORF Transcript_24706/g.51380 Transcript_24706/m.51380 type:complete len:206 (-) Transcript_24706:1523-2140(-)